MFLRPNPSTALLLVAHSVRAAPETDLYEWAHKIAHFNVNFTMYEEELIDMIKQDSKYLNSDIKNAVAKTVQMLDHEVLQRIEESHSTDMIQLALLRDSFRKCERIRQMRADSIEHAERAFDTVYELFHSCKVGDKGESKKHKASHDCDSVKKVLLQKKNIECAQLDRLTFEYPKLPGRCMDQARNGYIAWIYENLNLYGDLNKKYEQQLPKCREAQIAYTVKLLECAMRRKEWTNKKRECDAIQRTVESSTCTKVAHTKILNQEYPDCYHPAWSAYKRIIVLLRKAEQSRLDEWRALQRIKCYLNVFTMAGDKKDEGLHRCKHSVFNTTKYNLFYWAGPSKAPLKGLSPYACTHEYKAKYYKNKLDKWAPAAKCVWCKNYRPTPAPTLEPTLVPSHFFTPRPSTAIAPPPTQARTRGEGCQLIMYKGKGLTGERLSIRFNATACRESQPCFGMNFIGDSMNDRMQSWSAKGSQCKFCFYKHEQYYDLVGESNATDVLNGGERMMETTSVIILDTQYDRRCPEKRSAPDPATPLT